MKAKYTEEQWEQARELKAQGLSYNKIAEMTGIHYKSVARRLKKESEPATVAAAASSKVDVRKNTSVVIVTENEEIVKHIYSDEAKNAVHQLICEELAHQDKLEEKRRKLYTIIECVEEQLRVLDDKVAYSEAVVERLSEDLERMEEQV